MKRISGIVLFAALALVLASCGSGKYEYPFLNPKLKVEKRIDNLMSLLTPEEKVGLIMNKSMSVDRLGIPSYNWWSEACHGVRQSGYTVFPQPIGMGASFNEQLVYDVFSAVSDEARANWNRSERVFNVEMGAYHVPGNPELTFWCPNINIFRDPRWGRGQEAYGEDPYHMSVLGVANVKGMQGNIRSTTRPMLALSTMQCTAVPSRSVTVTMLPSPCVICGRPICPPLRLWFRRPMFRR